VCLQIEDLRKKKSAAEGEYRNSMPASSYQQQKLRVCEVCSAYLGIHDNDRRLADHFGGKLHLGFIKIREKLADLEVSIASGCSGIFFKLLRPSYCLNSCINARFDVPTASLPNIQVFFDVTPCHLCNLRDLYAAPCGRIFHPWGGRTRCIFYHILVNFGPYHCLGSVSSVHVFCLPPYITIIDLAL